MRIFSLIAKKEKGKSVVKLSFHYFCLYESRIWFLFM
jgi:hypothetical protein